MSVTSAQSEWLERNQRGLVAELSRIRAYLDRQSAAPRLPSDGESSANEPTHTNDQLLAIDIVASRFQLSPFERDVLLLCAGVELDSSLAAICATAQGDRLRAFPTFSLALSALPSPHWS